MILANLFIGFWYLAKSKPCSRNNAKALDTFSLVNTVAVRIIERSTVHRTVILALFRNKWHINQALFEY